MSEDDTETKLVAALWQVVAEHGWNGASMARLAAASGIPAAEVRRLVPTRLHLLRLHGRVVDRAVLAGTVPGQGGTARDRVFDVLMRRIDAMQPYRPGILRLLRDLPRDPLLAAVLWLELPHSMAWMLEAAELPTGGPLGFLRAKGLVGLWLATIRAWVKDDSEDLGPTMAALDRVLDRADQIARSLRLDQDNARAD